MGESELLAPSHCLPAALEISPICSHPISHLLLQFISLADSEVTENTAMHGDMTAYVRTASLRQEQDTEIRHILVVVITL